MSEALAPGKQQSGADDVDLTLQVMESPITSIWRLALSVGAGEACKPAGLTTGLALTENWLAVRTADQATQLLTCSSPSPMPWKTANCDSVISRMNIIDTHRLHYLYVFAKNWSDYNT